MVSRNLDSNKTMWLVRHTIPGFPIIMSLVLFSIPFGEMQGRLTGGLTVSKILIPSLFLFLLLVRQGSVKLHPHLPYFMMFVALTSTSLLIGSNYLLVLVSLSGYIILFQLVYSSDFSFSNIRSMLLAYVFGLGVISILTIVAMVTGFDMGNNLGKPFVEYLYGLPVFYGTAENPNGFASLFVVGLPLSFAFYLVSQNGFKKVLFAFIGVAFLFSVFMTFSRSGIVGSVLACGLIYYHRNNRKTLSLKFFLLGTSLLILLLLSQPGYYFFMELIGSESVTDTAGIAPNKEMSLDYRLRALRPMLSILVENPVFGVGYGNVMDLMEERTGLHVNAHNSFFGIAIDYGLAALFFYSLTIIISTNAMIKAIRLTENKQDRIVKSSILGSVLGLIFHSMFHELYISFLLWFFMALGAVILRLTRIDMYVHSISTSKK